MILLHMLCSERDRSNRIPTEQSVNSHPLIHATLFMMTSRNPDHGLSSSMLQYIDVRRQRQGSGRHTSPCVLQARCESNLTTLQVLISEKSSEKTDASASDFTILILAPPEFYGTYTEWFGNPSPNALFQRLNYSSSTTSPFNDFVDAKTQVVVQIYDLIESHCTALYKQQCDNRVRHKFPRRR